MTTPIRSVSKALFIAPESAYDTQNTTDAQYLPVKTTQGGLGEIEFLDEFSGVNYAVGLPRATREEHLRSGAQISVELVWTPYPTGALTDGGTVPATEDALDLLLKSALGTVRTIDGEGVASYAAPVVTLDTATHEIGDVLITQEAGVNSSRAQARLVVDRTTVAMTGDANQTGTITGAALSFGYRSYRSEGEDGASFSGFYVDDDTVYELSGGMFIMDEIMIEAGGLVRVRGNMRFNQIVYVGDPGGAAIDATEPTSGVIIENPVKAAISVVHFDGTDYSGCTAISFKLNPNAIWEAGLDGANGRVGQKILTNYATMEATFGANTAWETAMRAENTGVLRLFVGPGTVSSGRCAGLVIAAQEAQVLAAGRADDGGRARSPVTFKIVHAGRLGASLITPPFFQIVRL